MHFYNLRKSIYINTRDFSKAVHNTTFMSYREPEGLDADRVLPELLKMTYQLSCCIKNYDRLSPHEIVDAMKTAHIRGINKVFKYNTYNTDFIIKKAYQTRDLEAHLLKCYNKIWEYINYLSPAKAA
jgi:hypothetical protein